MAGGVTWLTSPARDAQYVSDHMSGRLSAGSAVWGHKNVLDLLPNVTVRSKRGTGDRGSCRGRRTGRRGGEGAGFKAEGEDSPGGTRIGSMTQGPSGGLCISVSRCRTTWVKRSGTVSCCRSALRSAETWTSGAPPVRAHELPPRRRLPRIGSAVFDYDPSLCDIVQSGATCPPVDDDGTLHTPFAEFEGQMLGGARTLDDLRRASAGPRRVIDVAG